MGQAGVAPKILWQPFLTVSGMVGVINSFLAVAFVGFVVKVAGAGLSLAISLGAVFFFVAVAGHLRRQTGSVAPSRSPRPCRLGPRPAFGGIGMTSNPLVGTWRLISWKNRSVEGRVSYPLGEDAAGYIMYKEDGFVFVAIARSNRSRFVAGDLLRGSTEEKAQAAEG